MNPQAYVRLISNDTELFTYLDTTISEIYKGSEYKLGDIILSLLDLNIDTVVSEYTDLLNDIKEPSLRSNDAALDDIRLRINELDERYPALWFHTHLLYYCFADVFCKDTFSINTDLLELRNFDKLFNDSGLVGLEKEIYKSKESVDLYYELIAKVLVEDIIYWKTEIKSVIEIIMKYSDFAWYKQLSPAQRLYYLDRVEDNIAHPSPFTFTNYAFKTKMILDDLTNEVAEIVPKERAKNILKVNPGLNEAYLLSNLHDYLQFELIKVILFDLPLLKCQNCGRVFIPRGRPDVKYCDKVAEGETLPCDAIGALRVYQHKVAMNPIFSAFNKAYKRMNSRVKYKTITQQEFYEWSEKARAMRDKCVNSEISLDELNEWLGNKPIDDK
jgi:hypothetical protein